MTTIQNIRVQYFCPPLDEVLEDADQHKVLMTGIENAADIKKDD